VRLLALVCSAFDLTERIVIVLNVGKPETEDVGTDGQTVIGQPATYVPEYEVAADRTRSSTEIEKVKFSLSHVN